MIGADLSRHFLLDLGLHLSPMLSHTRQRRGRSQGDAGLELTLAARSSKSLVLAAQQCDVELTAWAFIVVRPGGNVLEKRYVEVI